MPAGIGGGGGAGLSPLCCCKQLSLVDLDLQPAVEDVFRSASSLACPPQPMPRLTKPLLPRRRPKQRDPFQHQLQQPCGSVLQVSLSTTRETIFRVLLRALATCQMAREAAVQPWRDRSLRQRRHAAKSSKKQSSTSATYPSIRAGFPFASADRKNIYRDMRRAVALGAVSVAARISRL